MVNKELPSAWPSKQHRQPHGVTAQGQRSQGPEKDEHKITANNKELFFPPPSSRLLNDLFPIPAHNLLVNNYPICLFFPPKGNKSLILMKKRRRCVCHFGTSVSPNCVLFYACTLHNLNNLGTVFHRKTHNNLKKI